MPAALLVTGGSGFVGGHVAAAGVAADWRVINADRAQADPAPGVQFRQMNITDYGLVAGALRDMRPDVVVHCAAIGDIDQNERDPIRAWRVNVNGTANVAAACADSKTRLIFISTSTVFDGRDGEYSEDEPPSPVNVYGRTKVAAEQAVQVLCPGALIVRISLAYGYPRAGGASFLTKVADRLRARQQTIQPSDEFRTPTDVLTLADALLELAELDLPGILHVGPRERISRYDFALKIAEALGADPALVVDRGGESVEGRAPRPKDVSFDTSRAHRMLRTPLLDTDAGLARVLAARS